MKPDEQVLRAHIANGPFQSGVDLGKWKLISIDWPYVLITVSATPHEGWPNAYCFRFECTNYPEAAVTAQPWDLERKTPLEAKNWPGGKERLTKAFRPDWKGGQCLYLPCDRISMEGHPDWRRQHPHLTWGPDRDITLYLGAIHELLNSSAYTGPRGS